MFSALQLLEISPELAFDVTLEDIKTSFLQRMRAISAELSTLPQTENFSEIEPRLIKIENSLKEIREAYSYLTNYRWVTEEFDWIKKVYSPLFSIEYKGQDLNIFKLFTFDKINENLAGYDYLINDPYRLENLYKKLKESLEKFGNDNSLFSQGTKSKLQRLLDVSYSALKDPQQREKYKNIFIPSEQEVNTAINCEVRTLAGHNIVNYYKILNILPNADNQTIKNAYIQMIRKYRSHSRPTLNEAHINKVGERLVNEAYQILKDPNTRLEYDRQYNLVFSATKPTLSQTKAQFTMFPNHSQHSYKQKSEDTFPPAKRAKTEATSMSEGENKNEIPPCLSEQINLEVFKLIYQSPDTKLTRQEIKEPIMKLATAVPGLLNKPEDIAAAIRALKQAGFLDYTTAGKGPQSYHQEVWGTRLGKELYDKLPNVNKGSPGNSKVPF